VVYVQRDSYQAEGFAWLHNNLPEKIKGQLCRKLQVPEQDRAGKEFLCLQVQGIDFYIFLKFNYFLKNYLMRCPIVSGKQRIKHELKDSFGKKY